MNNVRTLMLPTTPDNIWKITAVTEADNTEVPKYEDRNRVGALVRSLLPLEDGMPVRLLYVTGEKMGGVIQHSAICRIEEVTDSERLRVFTANTMVELELVVVEYQLIDLIAEHQRGHEQRDPGSIVISKAARDLWMAQMSLCAGTPATPPPVSYGSIKVHTLVIDEQELTNRPGAYIVRVQAEEL